MPGVGIPPALARVASVSLETDDPVDDIRIDLESGQRALVQAKRSLTAGKPLKEAVAQWVQAARAGLDPTKDRLVIVSGTLSEPMRSCSKSWIASGPTTLAHPRERKTASWRVSGVSWVTWTSPNVL